LIFTLIKSVYLKIFYIFKYRYNASIDEYIIFLTINSQHYFHFSINLHIYATMPDDSTRICAMSQAVQKNQQWLTVFALVGATALWASSFVALKYTFTQFEAWFVIFARMAIASVFVLLFFRKALRGLTLTRSDWKYLIIMALFEPCLYFIFEAEALKNTTASQAGMITALLPIMVALGAWVWIKEQITWRVIAGGILAFVGAVWLSLGAPISASAPRPVYGNIMEFLAMVSATGYILTMKHITRRFSALFVTVFQAFSGTVFFALLLVLTGTKIPTSWPVEPTLALLYLGIAVTFGAYGLYNYGTSKMPAAQSSLYINLIPLFTVILSYLLLGESLGWNEVLGGLVILSGVVIAQSDNDKATEKVADPDTPKGV
jgi:drug/metabolite transporter (DMT)-like permease